MACMPRLPCPWRGGQRRFDRFVNPRRDSGAAIEARGTSTSSAHRAARRAGVPGSEPPVLRTRPDRTPACRGQGAPLRTRFSSAAGHPDRRRHPEGVAGDSFSRPRRGATTHPLFDINRNRAGRAFGKGTDMIRPPGQGGHKQKPRGLPRFTGPQKCFSASLSASAAQDCGSHHTILQPGRVW